MQQTHKPNDIESWLEQLGQPSADRDYKPGHARMHDLLAPLNLKRPKLRIRIAGTNGKGSTAFMLAEALQACGLNVGLYTSPHIHHFNERIRINGEPISNGELLSLIETMMPEALAIGASYFETATALALKHFSDSEVNVEILEAGVGARLDATTAVEADMALITPIGMDHQAWLGDTIESVASEKAYVADGCSMVLSAVQLNVVMPILKQHAPKLEVIKPDKMLSLSMSGNHQRQNAALALNAAKRLLEEALIDGPVERIKEAIESTIVPGRLQKVQFGEATIWIDAAHNRHAVEALLTTLATMKLDCVLIYTREDRDLSDTIDLLRPFTKRVVGEKGNGLDQSYPSAMEAMKSELTINPQGNYLIIGSFITVAATLKFLESA